MIDVSERRILGAFRMVSAITGTSIDSDFVVDAGKLDVLRNRSGVFLVRDAPGMRDLTFKSDVRGVTLPAQQQFELTVKDDDRVYLPRRFKLTLPRKIGPTTDPDSVFNAVIVQMYPTAAAPVAQSWALLRVSVIKAGDPARAGLPWSLVQVTRKSDNTVLKTGLSDARGEALVSVIGLPARSTNGGSGTLLSSEVDVDVTAFFDPANADKPQDFVPDPDDLIAKLGTMKSNSQPAKIASGRTNKVAIEIAV
jgi:hypothetical protein